MVAGVCGGIGRRYRIDPAVLRIAFVIAALLAGIGLFAYAALWLLVPDDRDRSSASVTRSLPGLIFGVVCGFLAITAALGWLGALDAFTILVGAALTGAAVWLYSRRETPGPLAVPPHVDGVSPPSVGYAYGGPGDQTWAAPPAFEAPPRPFDDQPAPVGPPRSFLGLIVFCAAVMVAGLLGVLQAAGWTDLSLVTCLAVVLAVFAAGLLISAFAGRARWLIIPAVLVTMTLAGTAQISSTLDRLDLGQAVQGGVGEPTWQPLSSQTFQLGAGSAVLDLTEWARDPQAEPPTVDDRIAAQVGVGELRVLVPQSWDVAVEAAVGAGDITVNGDGVDGIAGAEAGFVEQIPAVGKADGVITLDLDTRLGTISIDQVRTVSPVGDLVKEKNR